MVEALILILFSIAMGVFAFYCVAKARVDLGPLRRNMGVLGAGVVVQGGARRSVMMDGVGAWSCDHC